MLLIMGSLEIFLPCFELVWSLRSKQNNGVTWKFPTPLLHTKSSQFFFLFSLLRWWREERSEPYSQGHVFSDLNEESNPSPKTIKSSRLCWLRTIWPSVSQAPRQANQVVIQTPHKHGCYRKINPLWIFHVAQSAINN